MARRQPIYASGGDWLNRSRPLGRIRGHERLRRAGQHAGAGRHRAAWVRPARNRLPIDRSGLDSTDAPRPPTSDGHNHQRVPRADVSSIARQARTPVLSRGPRAAHRADRGASGRSNHGAKRRSDGRPATTTARHQHPLVSAGRAGRPRPRRSGRPPRGRWQTRRRPRWPRPHRTSPRVLRRSRRPSGDRARRTTRASRPARTPGSEPPRTDNSCTTRPDSGSRSSARRTQSRGRPATSADEPACRTPTRRPAGRRGRPNRRERCRRPATAERRAAR